MAKKRSGKRDTVRQPRATLYAQRDARRRFTDLTETGRSLQRDRRTRARTKVKSGYGHRGDRAA